MHTSQDLGRYWRVCKGIMHAEHVYGVAEFEGPASVRNTSMHERKARTRSAGDRAGDKRQKAWASESLRHGGLLGRKPVKTKVMQFHAIYP
eukprot:1161878-Pelagomonas_calceolata.AAC.6